MGTELKVEESVAFCFHVESRLDGTLSKGKKFAICCSLDLSHHGCRFWRVGVESAQGRCHRCRLNVVRGSWHASGYKTW